MRRCATAAALPARSLAQMEGLRAEIEVLATATEPYELLAAAQAMALEGSESGELLRRMSGAPEKMAGAAEAAERATAWSAGGVVGSGEGSNARVVGSGGGSDGKGSVVGVPRGSEPGSRSWPGSGPGSGPGSNLDELGSTQSGGGSFLSYERLAKCGNGRVKSSTLRTAVARSIGAAENGRQGLAFVHFSA